MAKRDPRIDAYIAKSADFAKPILKYIRAVVHEGCPDAEETLKWGAPTLMYHGILCGMAAFKEHCGFIFWKGSLILGDRGESPESMGQFGKLRTMSDLPPKKVLLAYIRQGMRLNEEGITVPKKTKPGRRKEVVVPDYMTAAFKKNKKAMATFDQFSPSHRKEYVEWITDATTDETRQRRLTQALEWIAKGKSRNWKYEKR